MLTESQAIELQTELTRLRATGRKLAQELVEAGDTIGELKDEVRRLREAIRQHRDEASANDCIGESYVDSRLWAAIGES